VTRCLRRSCLRSDHRRVYGLAAWVREAVLAADPDLAERVYRGWRGVGFRHPEAGYVCGIFPRDGVVELLFEHGASMPEPDNLLRGVGIQTSVIPVTEPDPALRERIVSYVQQAVARRLL
jgi:hypothetical protein